MEETSLGFEQTPEFLLQALGGLLQTSEGLEQKLEGLEQTLEGTEQNLEGLEQNLEGLEQTPRGLEQTLEGLEQIPRGPSRSEATGSRKSRLSIRKPVPGPPNPRQVVDFREGRSPSCRGGRSEEVPGSYSGWARITGAGAGPRLYQGDIMKKQVKKLALAKETLRNLEESGSLKNAAGGTQRDTVCVDCASGFVTCSPTGLDCQTRTYLC